jgi:hypothetical protein
MQHRGLPSRTVHCHSRPLTWLCQSRHHAACHSRTLRAALAQPARSRRSPSAESTALAVASHVARSVAVGFHCCQLRRHRRYSRQQAGYRADPLRGALRWSKPGTHLCVLRPRRSQGRDQSSCACCGREHAQEQVHACPGRQPNG